MLLFTTTTTKNTYKYVLVKKIANFLLTFSHVSLRGFLCFCAAAPPSGRRRLPCGPVPMPQAPGAPLTQSNPNLSAGPYCQSPAHRHPHSPGGTLEGSDSSPATPGECRRANGDVFPCV